MTKITRIERDREREYKLEEGLKEREMMISVLEQRCQELYDQMREIAEYKPI